jgi:hypothetical protein
MRGQDRFPLAVAFLERNLYLPVPIETLRSNSLSISIRPTKFIYVANGIRSRILILPSCCTSMSAGKHDSTPQQDFLEKGEADDEYAYGFCPF